MLSDTSLTVAKRPEPDLRHRWGIYSAQRGRWLDVVCQSEREAFESLKVLLPHAQTTTSRRMR